MSVVATSDDAGGSRPRRWPKDLFPPGLHLTDPQPDSPKKKERRRPSAIMLAFPSSERLALSVRDYNKRARMLRRLALEWSVGTTVHSQRGEAQGGEAPAGPGNVASLDAVRDVDRRREVAKLALDPFKRERLEILADLVGIYCLTDREVCAWLICKGKWGA